MVDPRVSRTVIGRGGNGRSRGRNEQGATATRVVARLLLPALTGPTDRSAVPPLFPCTPVTPAKKAAEGAITREQLIENLNDDLAREYQAIIAYVVYSQAIKGAQFMQIAKELEVHAGEELAHALTIAKQIDYLGGEITATPKVVKTSEDSKQMLRFDLENEATTIRAYRDRIRECEILGEFAIAEHIRRILTQEQDHLIELATALGEDPPNVAG